MLDHDRSVASQNYPASPARYFLEQAPLEGHADLDAHMRAGELAMAIEIPPGFGCDLERGHACRRWRLAGRLDAAARRAGARAYVGGVHNPRRRDRRIRRRPPARARQRRAALPLQPRVLLSLVSMVPKVILLLLVFIPAMLTALGVVREDSAHPQRLHHAGDPARVPARQAAALHRAVDVQLCAALLLAVTLFQVPFKGSFLALATGALLYVTATTGLGLLASTLTNSQIAATRGTSIGTLLPAIQFSG